MDAEMDVSGGQGLVERAVPQALAADFAQRLVLDLVADGLDRHDLDVAVGPALRGLDRRRDLARLGQRQRRTASPEPEAPLHLHGPPLAHPTALRQRVRKWRSSSASNPRATTPARRWSHPSGKYSLKSSSARPRRTS